jgi:hypothetical protein
MKISKTLLFLFAAFLLSCTTEEVPDEPVSPEVPAAPELLTGKFMETPVEGLKYRSESQEGVTNSNGEFVYEEGEMVEFFVGDIKIGEAVGSEKISPVDIAETPNASVNSDEVKNIAAFLQTLDVDNNPQNGVKITAEVVEALPVSMIDFQETVISTLGEIALEVNKNTLANLEVVLPEKATQHLAETLGEEFEVSGLEAGPFYNIVENWETRTNNVQWIHEFDSQGRISSSKVYWKYPMELLYIYTYSEYNAQGYPQLYSSDRIRKDGSVAWTLYFYLTYSQDAVVSSIAYNGGLDYSPSYRWEIEEFDSKMRVTELVTYSNDEAGSRQTFEFDDQTNYERFEIISLNGNGVNRVHEYYYTDFGAVSLSKTYQDDYYSESKKFYRENYTLEKQINLEQRSSQPDETTIIYQDEERFVYKREEFSADFLFQLTERNTDGSSKTTIYDEEDGSYYIEYRDTNNQKYKTEYYDSEGNLVDTEE